MSKYSKAKGRSKAPQFVMLRFDIIDSDAWQSLSPKAQALWCHLMRRFNGHNNGSIPLACREAGKLLNVSKNTANKAFLELEDRGLIKVGFYAGFKNKKRMATRWIMTHESHEGRPPTNEWKAYKEPEKI
jgi:hypothetical protein